MAKSFYVWNAVSKRANGNHDPFVLAEVNLMKIKIKIKKIKIKKIKIKIAAINQQKLIRILAKH